MTSPCLKDLFVLAADSQIQRTIGTLLGHRRMALNICGISFEVQRHPRRDPGCRTESASFLDTTRDRHRKAMVVFDFQGSGENYLNPAALEQQLEQECHNRGWEQDQIAFIVIDPELEAWAFGATFGHLQRAAGWNGPESIQDWLTSNGHLLSGAGKPSDPKAAIETLLLQTRRTRSAKFYEELARSVSLTRCQDRAFQKFRDTLRRWFLGP